MSEISKQKIRDADIGAKEIIAAMDKALEDRYARQKTNPSQNSANEKPEVVQRQAMPQMYAEGKTGFQQQMHELPSGECGKEAGISQGDNAEILREDNGDIKPNRTKGSLRSTSSCAARNIIGMNKGIHTFTICHAK